MSEAHDHRPWFRPKAIGVGWTPASWQGWLLTLLLCLVITATVQLIVPQDNRLFEALPWLAAVRRDLGIPPAGVGASVLLAAVPTEIAIFSLVAWLTSRPVKPLD